jgi:hypothetical protein
MWNLTVLIKVYVVAAHHSSTQIVVRIADFGVEKSVAVEGLDAAAVEKELEKLTSSS